ncbi:MAG: aminomethyl-transferring glycine dehydrogenase [Gemmatimonadota bacterium]
MSQATSLEYTDRFVRRHIGPTADELRDMLEAIGYDSLDSFIETVIPAGIRFRKQLSLPAALSEYETLQELREIARQNRVFRSYLGMGYHDTITPAVIQRKVLENPSWYTAYTPYQAEIAQGRLEALLNFQTVCIDLTGLPIANASLLDEATAAAEAMSMSHAVRGKSGGRVFFVSDLCHPQTIDVVRTRARARGWDVVVGDWKSFEFSPEVIGVLIQYPATDGAVIDYSPLVERARAAGAIVTVAADLLSLVLLRPPGEWGADIVIGSSQRFGVPMGYGGPHAAFLSTKDEYKRHLPGRIIGVSTDSRGKPALRMALQTREQHIRREKATSNVCTAQVLLAVIASMYAVYHGPEGLKKIAKRVHRLTALLAEALVKLGYDVVNEHYFDTLRIRGGARSGQEILKDARNAGINVRLFENGDVGIALDETVAFQDIADLVTVFAAPAVAELDFLDAAVEDVLAIGDRFRRTSNFLTHPVFNTYQSEHEMLRYIHRLESRDLSLTTSMIPLGSCTMKLNAATEMFPVTWPEFSKLHPFAPRAQAQGYGVLITQLEQWLAEITGFAAVSMQPNAGSQGELTGLLVIRAYHESRGQKRDVCLIPQSAHGTNPASAVMAGLNVVVVKVDDHGSVDIEDLRAQSQKHRDRLAALMITYPSTHGIFEKGIRSICDIVHENGGQVYMDGANMNAMVGLCRPGEIGADVCHLNLHKTFCIPHGGGGPGMGPIGVAQHLAPFLPGHPVIATGGEKAITAVSAAPWGSPEILPISWAYIRMMGHDGLTDATKVAILNANYIAKRLSVAYPVLYTGHEGTVAHECIIDPRPLKNSAGVEAVDIAKRLMDYGFHAPTVSFPVAGTLMIEPTESESLGELDRFCDALIGIREEIREIEMGIADRTNNVLKNAPHTADMCISDSWDKPYGREKAAYPAPWTRAHKFWPSVGLVESAAGDRNLICSCPPLEEYAEMNAE